MGTKTWGYRLTGPLALPCLSQRAGALFRFQIKTRLGAKPQTVLQHGKAKQRHIGLIWKWN